MKKIFVYAMTAFALTTISSFASEALPEEQKQEAACEAQPEEKREPAATKEIRETRIRN